jgi:hypothetical protein
VVQSGVEALLMHPVGVLLVLLVTLLVCVIILRPLGPRYGTYVLCLALIGIGFGLVATAPQRNAVFGGVGVGLVVLGLGLGGRCLLWAIKNDR